MSRRLLADYGTALELLDLLIEVVGKFQPDDPHAAEATAEALAHACGVRQVLCDPAEYESAACETPPWSPAERRAESLQRLHAALERIAREDYRGPVPDSVRIAREALGR